MSRCRGGADAARIRPAAPLFAAEARGIDLSQPIAALSH
jgi:hypothetical protein